MLEKLLKLGLTRSEMTIYKLICDSKDFSYSLSEIMRLISASRQTVVTSLQNLVTKNLVDKKDFYVGKVRRCRYSIKNLTSLDDNSGKGTENLTSLNIGETGLNIAKGEPKSSPTNANKVSSSNFIKILKKDNNIYQENTPMLSACQEKKERFLSFFSSKKRKASWDAEYKHWDAIHNLEYMSDYKYWDTCKYVLKNMLREGNSELLDFLKARTSHEVHMLLDDALGKIKLYIGNVKTSVGGYMRKIILSSIAMFDANVDRGWGAFSEPEVYEASMEDKWQNGYVYTVDGLARMGIV